MPGPDADVWMRCSACRKDIPFRTIHWICSVSTCNHSRTRLVFCGVACWDSHVATLRHRDAWAVEARSPSRDEHTHQEETVSPSVPTRALQEQPRQRVTISPAPSVPATTGTGTGTTTGTVTAHGGGPALSSNYEHDDVLIVVSKMKKYIRDRSGMNTSDAVADALGDHVRGICDDAIRTAANDGRKTVLDRDVPKPRR